MIRWLDRRLRRRLGVFELIDDPEMILRVQIVRSTRALPVPGGEIPAGERVLELHFWNEHMPKLPREGPNMEWGIRAVRMLTRSCRTVARHMREDERLAGVAGVCGSTVLFFPGQESGGERVSERLGFTAVRAKNPLGPFGEFWENFHTWMLMWAFNAATLRHHRLLRMRRTNFWATAEHFARRHGG
jgi:hypothetical protein